MARVVKSNPLIKQNGSIGSIYAEFLRDKNSLCAKSTVNIYKRLGEKFFIPQLSELTGDDMNKVTKETLRTILDDYEADHDEGGKVFIWAHLKSFINWYWQEYEIPTANPTQYIHVRRSKIKKPRKSTLRGFWLYSIQGSDVLGQLKVLVCGKYCVIEYCGGHVE